MNKALLVSSSMVLMLACYALKEQGSIPDGLERVQVSYFENRADLINPAMSQSLTEALKEKIQNESRLRIVNDGAQGRFTGHISSYRFTPVAPSGTETSSTTRLTVSVKVSYEVDLEGVEGWEETFTRYADFSSNLNASSIEGGLVEQINVELVDEIFRRAFVNW